MSGWLVNEGNRWTVKLDVRDLGGHLDTTISGWSATLVAQVRLVISRLASLLASSSLQMLRSSISRVVWSRRQPLANVGALLSLLYGPQGCDSAYCVFWLRFWMLRRYLAYRPAEVGRVYRLLDMVTEGCSGHGPIHLLACWLSVGPACDLLGSPWVACLEQSCWSCSVLFLVPGRVRLQLICVLGVGFVAGTS